MSSDRSNPPILPKEDVRFVRRAFAWIAVGFVVFAAVVHVNAVYARKFKDVTSPARWIWAPIVISRGVSAAFFAARDFDLPPNRTFTHIKVAADPEYTLYFNGVEIGGRRQQEVGIDVYDVSTLAKDQGNRIVVAVRANRGVGGLLVAVDISPEYRNWVVSDDSWKTARVWRPDFLLRDVVPVKPPLDLGGPPMGRWNFLRTRNMPVGYPPELVRLPAESFRYQAKLAEHKIVSGTAIMSSKEVPAIVYDFGDTDARIRITRLHEVDRARLLKVRFANVREELDSLQGGIRPFVFAQGEATLVDPEVRRFRYVAVYETPARLEALVRQ